MYCPPMTHKASTNNSMHRPKQYITVLKDLPGCFMKPKSNTQLNQIIEIIYPYISLAQVQQYV